MVVFIDRQTLATSLVLKYWSCCSNAKVNHFLLTNDFCCIHHLLPHCHTMNVSMILKYFHHAVPTKPQNVTVSRAVGLPTQLHITWTEPAKPNGVITSYTVRCAAITGESEVLEPVVVSGNILEVYVTGLEPYTEYGCFVTANTSAGEGEPSTKDTAVTDESCENICMITRITVTSCTLFCLFVCCNCIFWV